MSLASGDVVRVIYYQKDRALRFALNDKLVGQRFVDVIGPVVPCVTCSSDTKCVIQIVNYWTG